MTILHSGTTKKYSENWDTVFSGKSNSAKKAQPKKKSRKKAAAKGSQKTSRPARKK